MSRTQAIEISASDLGSLVKVLQLMNLNGNPMVSYLLLTYSFCLMVTQLKVLKGNSVCDSAFRAYKEADGLKAMQAGR